MRRYPRIRKLLPWIVAGLLLTILFWRVPSGELARSLHAAQLTTFIGILGAACVGWFLLDAAAYSYLFSRFNRPLGFREARELRGLTYLLTPVNWNLGRAAVIARLRQMYGVPILEATSSMALYQTLDALMLSTLCGIGLVWMPASGLVDALAPVALGVFVAAAIYLVLLLSSWPATGFLDRLRRARIHQSHRCARPRDVAWLLTFRLAYYAVFVGVYSWGPPAFGFELPLPLILASVPILQAIGVLPISPAGLGTQQAAMLFLFAGHGEPAAIIAFGLSFPLITILLRSAIGALYLGRVAHPPVQHQHGAPSMPGRFP